MIEMFKIMKGIDKIISGELFSKIKPRGHNLESKEEES